MDGLNTGFGVGNGFAVEKGEVFGHGDLVIEVFFVLALLEDALEVAVDFNSDSITARYFNSTGKPNRLKMESIIPKHNSPLTLIFERLLSLRLM